ncbi:MAG: alpha-mannosidase [Anaerolineae bacterium]|nr:alpha-mannosidase [Anaerolineae bacterium]
MSNPTTHKLSGTLHLIGNAHIDPVWLWPWTEGYQETRATFRSALDRMREFPQFVFTASQAAVYRWVEEAEPDLFAEIRQRVQEGRWCIVNGWWMEPDCNIPAGESLARQSLYGQRFFREKFGLTCRVGYCVDSFGHHGMMPQLLRQGGFQFYVFMRPGRAENPNVPRGPFWWESPDGSRVLAYSLLSAYGSGGDALTPEALRKVAEHCTESVRDQMFFYGVGNHGGGPTIANLKSLEAMQHDPALPTLEFSSPDRYFDRLLQGRPDLPVLRDELEYHAVGCYSAHAGVKQWNRKAEHSLLTAERWATVSHLLTQMPYPQQELTSAWHTVLFNQFHDILAGSSIREAYEDARNAYGAVLQTAQASLNVALQRIAAQVDTRGGESAVIVFNPHAFPVRAPVEHELMTWHLGNQPLHLVDEAGQEVVWQAGPISATVPPGWRTRLCFLADLPPLGYRVYHLNRRPAEAKTEAGGGPQVERLPWTVKDGYEVEADGRANLAVENEYLQLEVDARLGDLRLWDKSNQQEVHTSRAAVGVVLDDPSDTWAHGVTSFRDECGRFADAEVRVAESGPLRVVVRSRTHYGRSTLIQDFILYRGLPWVEVRVAVDWQERLKMLKLAFPVHVAQPVATFEIPYGAIERVADGREVAGQGWFDVTGQTGNGFYGLSILNDGKYGFDVLGAEMRMTVLRSPVYAHHTPHKLEAGQDYHYMDQGWHEFRYILLPHAGTWQEAGTARLAQVLNAPPLALTEGIHGGSLPAVAGHLAADADNVLVTVLKKAEEGDDLIVRCQETAGMETATTLRLPLLGREVAANLGPWQIKTWRIPRDARQPAREVNFLEE